MKTEIKVKEQVIIPEKPQMRFRDLKIGDYFFWDSSISPNSSGNKLKVKTENYQAFPLHDPTMLQGSKGSTYILGRAVVKVKSLEINYVLDQESNK